MQQHQHPVFIKYTRDWLHQATGFSKGYLCRVAKGKAPLSRSFVERICYRLGEPVQVLFLPEEVRRFPELVGESQAPLEERGEPQTQGIGAAVPR